MATISNVDIGSTSIITLGVVTTGTWSATVPIGLAYGGTNNASLTASNGGILYSTATTLAVLAGTATADQGLFSGASTTPAWSTNKWPTTIASGSLPISTAANTVGSLASVTGGVLYINSSTILGALTLTNGQYPGYTSSGTTIVAATPTSGPGVTVTLGAGSITVSTPAIVNQTTTSVTLAAGNYYLINDGSNLITLTLPASPTIGDRYTIIGGSSGGWKIGQVASQFVQLPGGIVTTTGTGGSISSSNRYDAIAIVASPTSHQFVAYWIKGNPTYV